MHVVWQHPGVIAWYDCVKRCYLNLLILLAADGVYSLHATKRYEGVTTNKHWFYKWVSYIHIMVMNLKCDSSVMDYHAFITFPCSYLYYYNHIVPFKRTYRNEAHTLLRLWRSSSMHQTTATQFSQWSSCIPMLAILVLSNPGHPYVVSCPTWFALTTGFPL